MGENAQVMLQVTVQVVWVSEGLGKLLRDVVLVVAIKEGAMREVIPMGEQTILQLKWSTCLSLSGDTFSFQDLKGI